MTPPLILASASPRRKELLERLGLGFEIHPGRIAEAGSPDLSPRELSQLNAYRKARAVASAHPGALILGADTLVCLGPRVFGKPADLNHAIRTLTELQGKTHEVVTGVCLLHLQSQRTRLFAAATSVTFRTLDREEIETYLTRINPLDKAGAYAIQEHGELIVEELSGSFSNVVGLPLERLEEELKRWNS